MKFHEIALFGVYVAPISIMMVAAFLTLIALRRIANCCGCCDLLGTRPCSDSQYSSHCRLLCFSLQGERHVQSRTRTRTRHRWGWERSQSRPPAPRPKKCEHSLPRGSHLVDDSILCSRRRRFRRNVECLHDRSVDEGRNGARIVVTVAPEVTGRIVELPISDNQFVHKGDVLMGVIDPTDYKIAVNLAEPALDHAKATAQNVESPVGTPAETERCSLSAMRKSRAMIAMHWRPRRPIGRQ